VTTVAKRNTPERELPDPNAVAYEGDRHPHHIVGAKQGSETIQEAGARLLVDGMAQNALVAMNFARGLPVVDASTALGRTCEGARKIANGDLSGVLLILASQVMTLNAVACDLIMRAQANYRNPDAFDRLMRLGLRAQSQSRATGESLSAILHPPVFAKNLQNNIANGPQQVNNGSVARGSRARARKKPAGLNKLLGVATHVERIERVDTGEAGAASGSDPQLAPVAAVNRPPKSKR